MGWVLNEEVLAVLAAVIIVSSVIAVVQVFNAGRVVEPFSELGLLGPGGKIGDYPKEVVAGLPFTLNIYVGNHEGKTAYYKALVKVGDSSSLINESTPLPAEPIMEVRAFLRHNSSQTFPVSITLYEPATRLRLVFEMWVFNETVRAFAYHGRWNQLWLNVTGAPLALESPPPKSVVTRRMEDRLVEGYMSVRRAEEAGGNVSEMVDLLNQALRLAQSGDEDGTEKIVGQVIAMEEVVRREGVEASRAQVYVAAGALATASTTGVGGFMFLRHRVWTRWARLHRGWRVVWVGGDSELSDLEKAIKGRVKSGQETRVESLVFSTITGYKTHMVARAIYRLARKGAVKLVDPSPPKSFVSYIFSGYGLGFASAALLVAASLLAVYGSDLTAVLAASRIVFGSLFVLFLPGYSLIEVLYPKESDLSPMERLALSIGLSLALVPLVGLMLNYSPWGIRLDPIVASLSMLTLALLLTSAYRKFSLLKLRAAAISG